MKNMREITILDKAQIWKFLPIHHMKRSILSSEITYICTVRLLKHEDDHHIF